MKVLKKIMALLYLVILCSSLSQQFIYVNRSWHYKYIYTYEIVTVMLTLVGALYYIWSIFKNDQKKESQSFLITLISYFLTGLFILSTYISAGDFSVKWIHLSKLCTGFYLYFSSAAILVLDFFLVLPYYKKKPSEKMITDAMDVQDQYFLCYYKNGLEKKFDDPKGNLAVVVVPNEGDKIEFSIRSFKNEQRKVLKENLISINITQEEENLPTRMTEHDKIAIETFLFNKFDAFIAGDNLLHSIENYGKKKVSKAYLVEIKYYENDKEKCVQFLCKDDPSSVLANIIVGRSEKDE